ALAELRRMGLIESRTKTGTRVISADFGQNLARRLGLWGEPTVFPEGFEAEVSEARAVEADKRLAARLGCEVGQPFVKFSVLRTAVGGSDAVWTTLYVRPDFAAVAEKAQADPQQLVIDLIKTEFGVAAKTMRQTFAAVTLSAKNAKRLGVKADDPAMLVVRAFLDAEGKPIEIAASYYAASAPLASTVNLG
ncbi:MAG: UTRA domain-containing protein, partial [Duodenibacillus sp.]|nr:UTRA domain-containing protein [Duodenibacillus sp.]